MVKDESTAHERAASAGRGTGRLKGVVAVVLAVLAIGPATAATAVGAEEAPLEPVESIAFTELGTRSPLSPGIARQRHFSLGFDAVVASPDGFARGESPDPNTLEVTEVTTDGEVTVTTLTPSVSFDDYTRVLQLTEDVILAEVLENDGAPWVTAATPMLVDRATGNVTVAPTADGEAAGEARISLGATVFVGATTVPIWRSVVAGALTGGDDFEDPSLFPDQLAPVMSPDGRFVAIGARWEDGDGVRLELWVTDTVGGETERIEIDCPASACEIVADAVASRAGEATVFVTVYEVLPGFGGASSTREAAERYAVDVDTGSVEPSAAVSLTSPNGRWAIGREATSGEVDLDPSRLVLLDLDTGRERRFDSNLEDYYDVEPIGLSDDGRTLRYATSYFCPDLCVARDAFFGTLDLAPVADVTRGPAEDQILRLYRAVFGRIPDGGGFEFWVERYRNGESLVAIAAAFADAPEFAARYGEDPTDAELVDALYRNTLGRAGDAGGVDFWLGRRADGMTVAELLVSFADSPENIDRTGTRAPLSVAEGRVLRLYRAMLGRAPDAGGLGFWVGQYHAGVSLLEIARRFAGEPEFAARYGADPSSADLIDAAYRNVLGREGDAGGVAYWNQRMDDGLSVAGLFVAFADSDENVENTGTVR